MNPGAAAIAADPASAERSSAAATWLGGSLLLFAALVPLTIAGAQIALTAAFLAWFLAGRPRAPSPLLAPAATYAALSLASALASDQPLTSLRDCKDLVLFFPLLAVPAAMRLRPGLAERLLDVWLLGALAGAVWGIGRYLSSAGGLEHRSTGPFGHYMTFGGMTMLAAIASFVPLALGPSRRAPRWLPAFVLLCAAVATSWARNAWLGLAAGLVLVVVLCRWRWLPWLVALALAAFLAASSEMQERFASSFDPGANRDRMEMLRFGVELVGAHPWLGAGPSRIAARWHDAHPGERIQPHLHGNLVQIAAERGLPALVSWCWLVLAVLRHAGRRRADPTDSRRALTALAATLALLVAGSFEYNFGDSEVKMAYLLLAALGVAETHHRSEST